MAVVDLAAPGGNVAPEVIPWIRDPTLPEPPLVTTTCEEIPCFLWDMVISTNTSAQGLIPGPYAFNFGTSFSAPHVAGVAALIIGMNGGDMHPNHVRSILQRSADDLGKPGQDDFYGHGRVNAANAVSLMLARDRSATLDSGGGAWSNHDRALAALLVAMDISRNAGNRAIGTTIDSGSSTENIAESDWDGNSLDDAADWAFTAGILLGGQDSDLATRLAELLTGISHNEADEMDEYLLSLELSSAE